MADIKAIMGKLTDPQGAIFSELHHPQHEAVKAEVDTLFREHRNATEHRSAVEQQFAAQEATRQAYLQAYADNLAQIEKTKADVEAQYQAHIAQIQQARAALEAQHEANLASIAAREAQLQTVHDETAITPRQFWNHHGALGRLVLAAGLADEATTGASAGHVDKVVVTAEDGESTKLTDQPDRAAMYHNLLVSTLAEMPETTAVLKEITDAVTSAASDDVILE